MQSSRCNAIVLGRYNPRIRQLAGRLLEPSLCRGQPLRVRVEHLARSTIVYATTPANVATFAQAYYQS